jgi:hypothetical protein
MMAAVAYPTLAVLLARVEPRRRVKVYIIALAALVTTAVALFCWLVARWLQLSRTVDPDSGGAS